MTEGETFSSPSPPFGLVAGCWSLQVSSHLVVRPVAVILDHVSNLAFSPSWRVWQFSPFVLLVAIFWVTGYVNKSSTPVLGFRRPLLGVFWSKR